MRESKQTDSVVFVWSSKRRLPRKAVLCWDWRTTWNRNEKQSKQPCSASNRYCMRVHIPEPRLSRQDLPRTQYWHVHPHERNGKRSHFCVYRSMWLVHNCHFPEEEDRSTVLWQWQVPWLDDHIVAWLLSQHSHLSLLTCLSLQTLPLRSTVPTNEANQSSSECYSAYISRNNGNADHPVCDFTRLNSLFLHHARQLDSGNEQLPQCFPFHNLSEPLQVVGVPRSHPAAWLLILRHTRLHSDIGTELRPSTPHFTYCLSIQQISHLRKINWCRNSRQGSPANADRRDRRASRTAVRAETTTPWWWL